MTNQRRDEFSTADIARDRNGDDRHHDPTAGPSPDDAVAARLDPDPLVDRADRPDRPDRAAAGRAGEPAPAGPLLDTADTERYQARWTDIQNGFVDEPRRAVEAGDALVAELMQELARTFADERDRLEGQWARGDDVSTDELRVAFQRYRVFFGRLLSA